MALRAQQMVLVRRPKHTHTLRQCWCRFIFLHYPFNIAAVCIDISFGIAPNRNGRKWRQQKYMNILCYERVVRVDFLFSLVSADFFSFPWAEPSSAERKSYQISVFKWIREITSCLRTSITSIFAMMWATFLSLTLSLLLFYRSISFAFFSLRFFPRP